MCVCYRILTLPGFQGTRNSHFLCRIKTVIARAGITATVFEAYFGCFEAGFIRLEGGISWVQNLDAVETNLILKSSPLQFFVKLLKHGMRNPGELRMRNGSQIVTALLMTRGCLWECWMKISRLKDGHVWTSCIFKMCNSFNVRYLQIPMGYHQNRIWDPALGFHQRRGMNIKDIETLRCCFQRVSSVNTFWSKKGWPVKTILTRRFAIGKRRWV